MQLTKEIWNKKITLRNGKETFKEFVGLLKFNHEPINVKKVQAVFILFDKASSILFALGAQ